MTRDIIYALNKCNNANIISHLSMCMFLYFIMKYREFPENPLKNAFH